MSGDDALLAVLDQLVGTRADSVTVTLNPRARSSLIRLRALLAERDIDSLLPSSKQTLLTRPPEDLTNPEDIRYFNLLRESYTVEHIQPPRQLRPNRSHAWGRGFRGVVKRAILASRFMVGRGGEGGARAAVGEALEAELDAVASWDAFDVNRVAQLSDRQPLLLVGMTALSHFGLLEAFNVPQEAAVNFIMAVEHHYMPNPYHNSTHAADVTQALLAMLVADGIYARFSDLELFALLLAAIIHDVGHPGLSNAFLTKTQDEQALMYNDQSANEALSLSLAFKILQSPGCNLFANMTREDYFFLRRLVTDIVLCTDMAVHAEVLEQAAPALHTSSPERDLWSPCRVEARLLAMKALVHVADISNAVRPPGRAGMWTRAVYEEFFRQGDAERQLGLDVSPLCDRETVAIAESQKAFLTFVVRPTWELLRDVAPRSHAAALRNLDRNLALWSALAERSAVAEVISEPDCPGPAPAVHICPGLSPFHMPDHTPWGNADMLLTLLNDQDNVMVAKGLDMLTRREPDTSLMDNLPPDGY